jgi:hypothetical protein
MFSNDPSHEIFLFMLASLTLFLGYHPLFK